jgi:hypothetical protein
MHRYKTRHTAKYEVGWSFTDVRPLIAYCSVLIKDGSIKTRMYISDSQRQHRVSKKICLQLFYIQQGYEFYTRIMAAVTLIDTQV